MWFPCVLYFSHYRNGFARQTTNTYYVLHNLHLPQNWAKYKTKPNKPPKTLPFAEVSYFLTGNFIFNSSFKELHLVKNLTKPFRLNLYEFTWFKLEIWDHITRSSHCPFPSHVHWLLSFGWLKSFCTAFPPSKLTWDFWHRTLRAWSIPVTALFCFFYIFMWHIRIIMAYLFMVFLLRFFSNGFVVFFLELLSII